MSTNKKLYFQSKGRTLIIDQWCVYVFMLSLVAMKRLPSMHDKPKGLTNSNQIQLRQNPLAKYLVLKNKHSRSYILILWPTPRAWWLLLLPSNNIGSSGPDNCTTDMSAVCLLLPDFCAPLFRSQSKASMASISL